MVLSTFTFSASSLNLEDTFTITATDATLPTFVTAVFSIPSGNQGGAVYRTFRVPTTTTLGTYRLTIHAWELGVFPSQTVTVNGTASNGNVNSQTLTMAVAGTSDPIAPVIDYFIAWLQSEPTLSGYADTFKKLRGHAQFLSETNAFYVYSDRGDVKGLPGTTKLEYNTTINIQFMEFILSKREADHNKHATFVRTVMEYVANNPQLNTNLGVVTCRPKAYMISWGNYEYTNTIVSKVELEIQLIPNYP